MGAPLLSFLNPQNMRRILGFGTSASKGGLRPQSKFPKLWGGVISLGVTALFIGAQAWLARPVDLPSLGREYVQSLSFNPVGRWGNPETGWIAPPQEVEAALKTVQGITPRVRIYTVDHGLHVVPEIAERLGMKVTLGTWVDKKDPARTRREIEVAIDLAKRFPRTIDRLLIGNEAILTREATPEELATLIREVRSRTGLPVSTGEPTGVWRDNPTLAANVDYVSAHILPFWVGESAKTTLTSAFQEFNDLQKMFPNKHIEIAEFGWPSGRFNFRQAVASPINQATLVRGFLAEAERRGITYNIIEAFDQPWKTSEGTVGQWWGIYDAYGRPKFPLVGPISPDPIWMERALTGAIIGAIISVVWLATRPRRREMIATAIIGQLAGLGAAIALQGTLTQYWTWGILISWILAVPMVIFLGLSSYERIRELIDCFIRYTAHKPSDHRAPLDWHGGLAASNMVSVHVPACRERPDVLAACLRSLAALRWEKFEVIVVINNTDDQVLLSKTRALCADLGSNFRCIYAPVLSGFKSGALNLARRHTSPVATHVAIVDADYVVEQNWLARGMPLFDTERVAAVQFPQEHFPDHQRPIRNAMNDEYAGFFDGGMVQRSLDNALILHGTMVIVRRDLLDSVGGWSEEHICEDTELGVRLLVAGYDVRYLPERMGQGVLPDDMSGFRRQRDRWVYGGMRIAIAHARDLLSPRGTRLSLVQRHHFLLGWSGWVGDAVALIAAVATIMWAFFMVAADQGEPPSEGLSFMIIGACLVGLIHSFSLHLFRVKRGLRAAYQAALIGLSLQTVIGLAVFRGLFEPGQPFKVTPKGGSGQPLLMSIRDVRIEFCLLAAQFSAAIALLWYNKTSEVTAIYLMVFTLIIQATPNLTAILLALLDAPRRPNRRHKEPSRDFSRP